MLAGVCTEGRDNLICRFGSAEFALREEFASFYGMALKHHLACHINVVKVLKQDYPSNILLTQLQVHCKL